MDEILASLTRSVETLIADAVGPAALTPVLGGLSWAAIGTAALFLLATTCISITAAALLRRRAANAAAEAAAGSWRAHVKMALRKPLHIFIWIYGLYAAATPGLLTLNPGTSFIWVRKTLDFVFDFGALVAIFWFLLRAARALENRLTAWAASTPSKIDDLMVPLLGATLRVVLIVIAIIVALPLLNLPPRFADIIGKLTSIAFIIAVAGLLVRAMGILQQVVYARYDMTVADNLRARKIYTQLHVISRVVYVVVALVAVSSILMLFQQVRHIGTSLLASAGVVGIIAGFAAQKTLANLFAGFQIALAQPVRQDDVVVVEGEWGRVEEITLTYIVVHIWDDRRLVLPLSYFIEKPFQNWTRTSAAILGSLFVWVDYAFPVEAGRSALRHIIESSALWDKRFWNMQVTDANDRSLQLRVLATAENSSKSFDLNCEIREKFIAFIQASHPQALPRTRLELNGFGTAMGSVTAESTGARSVDPAAAVAGTPA